MKQNRFSMTILDDTIVLHTLITQQEYEMIAEVSEKYGRTAPIKYLRQDDEAPRFCWIEIAINSGADIADIWRTALNVGYEQGKRTSESIYKPYIDTLRNSIK